MQRLISWYDNLTIKIKLRSIIFITLLMLGAASIAGLGIVNKSNQELLYNTLASSMSYSAMQIRNSMDEVESLSFQLITDAAIQEQLAAVKDQPDDMVVRSRAFRQLNTVLQNYLSQYGSLQYISLNGVALNVDTNTVWAEKLPEETRIQMQEEAIAAEGRARWFYQGTSQNSVLAVRSIRRIEPYWLDTLGVVVMSVQIEEMMQGSIDFGGKFGENYYLLTNDSQTLFCSEYFPEGLEDKLVLLEDGDYAILKSGNRRYFAIAGTIPDYGWRYVHLILYDDMYKAITESVLLYVLVILFGASLGLALCNRLVKRLVTHISALIGKMRDFSKDNTKQPISAYDYKNRNDEIGLLHQKFDEMASRIISLIQNEYTNQILMKDAQLKALEAQIDPHFLYNVLQSISWSAKEIGDEQIPKMVDALGKMLRTTLSKEDVEFTIEKEVDFVRNYMTIQQFRFEGGLDFKLEIPESMLQVRLPKLCIQPLVENAIRYARDEIDGMCYIEVIGEDQGEDITISVKNTGSAFDEQLLENLENSKVKPNGFGIGLLNIQKRLQLYGGEAAYLELINEDGMAVACIHLPK
ncbi:histidine kinase [Lachnospiraceae bacterium OttesenSCG-928-D06]|nr:histidine kinase [Lachnospiraceae bacterium OttesenSCG-928-D06]